MHSPGFDAGAPGCVGEHCAAETSTARRRTALHAVTLGHIYLGRCVRMPGLLRYLDTVALLHRVIPVAMEDDGRYGLRDPAARRGVWTWRGLHCSHGRLNVVRTSVRHARMGAHACEQVWIGLPQDHRHRGAGR